MKRKILGLTILFIYIYANMRLGFVNATEIPVWNPSVRNNESENIENIELNNRELTEENRTIASSISTEDTKNDFNTNAILTSKTTEEDNFVKQTSSNTVLNENNSNVLETNANEQKSEMKLHTVSSTETNNNLNLTCGGAILVEQNSGNILYDHNMHERLRPASVTKVMTLLLIMEALKSGEISINDRIPCTEDAAKMGGSQIWLDTTEELTVDEMLKAICVVSANDCTVAMADYLAGSQEAFVEKMNKKAQELGMNDTCFKNCHGIDEDGHLTSPYDIAIMSRELLVNYPEITKYTTIYMDSLRDGKSQLVNTNKLVRNYEGCTGLKTGSTSVALFNLSASATRNGLSLIAVIMKGESSKIRFSEASKLLNYGFGNYQYKQVASKGEIVGECTINKGLKNKVNAVFENDFGFVMSKNENFDVAQNVEIYNNVFAPIEEGEKIGKIYYTINNEKIGEVNLISSESVDKYGFKAMAFNIYKNWFTLFRE